ncbi:MAG: hypothetical protein HND56_10120 [Pseudomonadota bacterium]|nr:hypothetical protein [Pseudomonadota bacterium]QKK06021.1 MAG: hypothetical protein HND56_10120 [Pseudomonadota bacterium]
MADFKELRKAYADKTLKIFANKDGSDYKEPVKTVLFGGSLISLLCFVGGMAIHSNDALPDKTGTENRAVVHEAFQKTARTLTSLHTQLDQGVDARNSAATMETLKRLDVLGTEIPAYIESPEDDAARQRMLDSELPKFLEALALDSDLTETDKDNFLKDLAKSGIPLENTIAAKYNAGAFDECRIKYDNAADIYACSPGEAQNLKQAGITNSLPGVGLLLLFSILLGATDPRTMRKYAKHHSMNH